MKSQPSYQQVPLNDDEKNLLLTIYRARLRMASVFYLVMLGIIMFYSITKVGSNRTNWNEKEDARLVSKVQMMLIGMAFLGIPTTCAGLYYFSKKVIPYRTDARNGLKNKVPYEIKRKEYFPLTDQYYFGLDDPLYLHHEVDAVLFQSCNEGDCIYLYRAPVSGYTFEMNGRFTIA